MADISTLIQSYNESVECYKITFIYCVISCDFENYETHIKQVKENVIINFEMFESNVLNYDEDIEDEDNMKILFNQLINGELERIDIRALNENIRLFNHDKQDIKILVKKGEDEEEEEEDEYRDNMDVINYAYILNIKKID